MSEQFSDIRNRYNVEQAFTVYGLGTSLQMPNVLHIFIGRPFFCFCSVEMVSFSVRLWKRLLCKVRLIR